MKIAMFLDSVFPPDSRVENEAVSLIHEGHDVFLFSFNYDDRPEVEEIKGITVMRYRANNMIYKLSALAYTLPFYHKLIYSKILRFIEQVKPDALHIHDMVIAPAVYRANEKFKLPVILDLHENRPIIMKEYAHLKRFPGKYLINILKWQRKQKDLMVKADKIILVTEEARQEAVSYGLFDKNKIVVVPNTIHLNIFKNYLIDESILATFKNTFNIVYTGDTGLRRGTDTAIKAINLLIRKIPDIRLIFVGRNTEDKVLKAMVERFNLKDHVQFEGWQDVSKFPSYIKAADVCISPLKRNLHHDTTYANKIFQYMAMGKPLLVSDCPAQMRVVEEENCGLIHNAGSETDMADKIMRLYNDRNLRLQLGENALKAVENRWNWNLTQKQLIHFYNNLKI